MRNIYKHTKKASECGKRRSLGNGLDDKFLSVHLFSIWDCLHNFDVIYFYSHGCTKINLITYLLIANALESIRNSIYRQILMRPIFD